MLVLSRKDGERIVIGPHITITVIETRGGRVRLGISAPDATPVHREEVFTRLAQANEEVIAHGEASRFIGEHN